MSDDVDALVFGLVHQTKVTVKHPCHVWRGLAF